MFNTMVAAYEDSLYVLKVVILRVVRDHVRVHQ